LRLLATNLSYLQAAYSFTLRLLTSVTKTRRTSVMH
jgi:hypothetical protein